MCHFGALRFKFLALVTGNDADPEYVKQNFGKEGTDIKGMAFRVNGALILSRGERDSELVKRAENAHHPSGFC